ncbi:MAG: DnaJ domain-containing protein, partial [Candidatus Wallbacteria bacterium]|nr:DnaJ domain-containing protein [Candidatus Wallbacteria bacterium]
MYSPSPDPEFTERQFFKAVFSISFGIWRATDSFKVDDGNGMRKVLTELVHKDREKRDKAWNLILDATHSDRTAESYAEEFVSHFTPDENTALCNDLFELLARMMTFTSGESGRKFEHLQSIARILRISPAEIKRIGIVYFQQKGDNFAMLGCQSGDAPGEIKKNYRNLAKEYHPDAARARGVPEVFIEQFSERFRKLHEAYSA